MIKKKCVKCKGRGRVSGKNQWGDKTLRLCSSCWGQGFRMEKTEKELMKDFRREQEILNAQGRL